MHRVLIAEDEILEFKRQYYISNEADAAASVLPQISRFDAAATAIFLRPGQICEIERPSVSSISKNYYRICVNF